MRRFNHAFTLGFSLVSNSEDASDVSHAMLMKAILLRLADLTGNPHEDLREACQLPYDTYEVKP